MMRHACQLLTVALLWGGTTFAQSSLPPRPGVTPPQQRVDRTLDLPITAPSYRPRQAAAPLPASTPAQKPTPAPPPSPPADPVDEPSQPPALYGESIPAEEDTIIFVLDISCSMAWDSQSYTKLSGEIGYGPRLDRAKVELSRSISGLSKNFQFNLVAYGCGVTQWSGELKLATEANKAAALAWLGSLNPMGATATGPATAQALSEKQNHSVVLLTDGMPNCGVTYTDDGAEAAHRRLIQISNTQGAVINVFGIAATASYRAFCQGVASDSGGVFFDVP
jgi:hypothetical protein